MKKQVVVIHGGDTFETREEYLNFLRDYEIDIERYRSDKSDWKPWLRKKLGDGYEVILPVMPNKTNAQFEEWKIWFEKLIPFLDDGVILVGHSLGGDFLAKYLSENKFPKKIAAVFLIAAVHDKDADGYNLATFTLPAKLDLQTEKVYLYHSKDDSVVPFGDLAKFEKALPTSIPRVFENRQHFNQEELLELAEDILNLS
ncbi:alpha/beta hydrolase [Candidatus Nomurabacteria bacterium]|nr:alpha/beta hydrolase [Candidatus Nomurabacteria bacterium]